MQVDNSHYITTPQYDIRDTVLKKYNTCHSVIASMNSSDTRSTNNSHIDKFINLQLPQLQPRTINSNNNDIEQHQQSLNQVPLDLLPLRYKGCTLQWAIENYRYCKLFDTNVHVSCTNDQQALLSWQILGQTLQKDLVKEGMLHTKNEILRIANELGLYIHGQQVRSLSDVLAVVASPSWYNGDKKRNRDILFMLQYGMYKKGHNLWAIRAAEAWLSVRKLTYADDDTPLEDGKIPRAKNGFVLKILMQTASDRITKKILTTTKLIHNEFVSVKNRPYDPKNKRNKVDDYIYSTHHFNEHHYYIATVIIKPLIKDFKYFESAVKTAHSHSVNREELVTLIHKIYDGLSNTQQACTALTGTEDQPSHRDYIQLQNIASNTNNVPTTITAYTPHQPLISSNSVNQDMEGTGVRKSRGKDLMIQAKAAQDVASECIIHDDSVENSSLLNDLCSEDEANSMELVNLQDHCENTSLQEHVITKVVSPDEKATSKYVHSDKQNSTEFNETCPIYACKHAYVKDHHCKYIECFNCHILPSRQECKAYKHRQKRIKKDNGMDCLHNNVNLQVWTDVHHIKELFKQHPTNLPTKCTECNKSIAILGRDMQSFL